MSERIYVPRCYAKERTGQYGSFLSITFGTKELLEFVQQHQTSDGYFRVTVSQRREPDKHGNTHSVSLDTYEPKKQTDAPPKANNPAPAKPLEDDDVPF